MVLTHLMEKEILDNSLPSSIVIGPFYINVDNVKQSLSKKRKTLANSMLDILAKNLHNEVESVSSHPPGPRGHSYTQEPLYTQCTPTSKMSAAKVRGACRGQQKELEIILPQSPYACRELSHMGGC